MPQAPRTFNFTEIGIFKTKQIEAYQAGRQPDDLSEPGVIELFSGQNFEQALQDLSGCSHIWVLFAFHKNENWKPLAQTPRSNRKIGVFATRAPYRPNPIGMSLVKLISVEGLKVTIAENDLLNDTPILDIKPYHPEADVALDSQIEWLQDSVVEKNQISFSPFAEEQLDWLISNQLSEIKSFIHRQLEYDPINKSKKRIEENQGYWTLSYRTWRIDFSYSEKSVGILAIRSGYSPDELNLDSDTYKDKELHRKFNISHQSN